VSGKWIMAVLQGKGQLDELMNFSLSRKNIYRTKKEQDQLVSAPFYCHTRRQSKMIAGAKNPC